MLALKRLASMDNNGIACNKYSFAYICLVLNATGWKVFMKYEYKP